MPSTSATQDATECAEAVPRATWYRAIVLLFGRGLEDIRHMIMQHQHLQYMYGKTEKTDKTEETEKTEKTEKTI
jgi:hypothetical protein